MHRRSVLVSLICAALIGFPTPASGSPTKERSDATERLTQITERIAEIDKAEASLRVEIADSREAAATAKVEAESAAERVEVLDAEVSIIKDRLRERAVSAYTGRFDSLDTSIFEGDSLASQERKVLLEVLQADDDELAKMLEDASDELSSQRRNAKRRQRGAESLETEMLDQLDDLKTLRSELDDQSAELERIVETERSAGETILGGELCKASGITVACEIADDMNALIAAAAEDGLPLTGSGYRDPAEQIALRKAHCGTSHAAIYSMSPSACSPPTARPGTSQHEVGLAIDFDNCSTRQTACYRWLAANAERFGFFNLPSESWHWSTTGS